MTVQSLRAQEKAIADGFTGSISWIMVFWGLANTAVWLALWPLVITGVVPLWLGFVIAAFNVTMSYLPSHDAQHYIFAAKGSRHEWFNEFIGHWSLIPLTLPLRTARITHLEHHRHANDPLLDPDFSTHATGALNAIWKTIVNRQPRADGGFNRYGQLLQTWQTPAAKIALRDAMIAKILFYGVLAASALSGYAIEAAVLWWLPRHLALTYISFYLSWAPHHPGHDTGRYNDTRAFKSRLGNLWSSGMQYHIVHHLYPTIPLNRTPAAYRALRPILEARGCEVSELHR